MSKSAPGTSKGASVYAPGGSRALKYAPTGIPHPSGIPASASSNSILSSPLSSRKVKNDVRWLDGVTANGTADARSSVNTVKLQEVLLFTAVDYETLAPDEDIPVMEGSSNSEAHTSADSPRNNAKDKKKGTKKRRSSKDLGVREDGKQVESESTPASPNANNGKRDSEGKPEEDRACRQCEECVIM